MKRGPVFVRKEARMHLGEQVQSALPVRPVFLLRLVHAGKRLRPTRACRAALAVRNCGRVMYSVANCHDRPVSSSPVLPTTCAKRARRCDRLRDVLQAAMVAGTERELEFSAPSEHPLKGGRRHLSGVTSLAIPRGARRTRRALFSFVHDCTQPHV